ncbi:MAG TPA: DUF4290 domain-containing protein [Prolixibacteraceae bacterium]|nr:DUF4290 domain-containing protein [Prolixibacteraceae bacterium]HPR60041.1 DUF4290 domain-containing protein [Prolixibacteraceae bacterium]
MDYNSNQKKLVLPEYGRNIQNMVDYVVTIEDREERQRAAQTIIDVMGNLYPYLRDVEDFRHKLWDHLCIMADFKLDIDYPYALPNMEVLRAKPNKIPYNSGRIKYKHYGIVVQKMIKRTAEFEEGADKDLLVQMIADHMKKCYLTWNKETVDDERVMADFQELSKGRIDVPEDFQLKDSKDLIFNTKKKNPKQQGKRQNQKKRQ